MALQGGVARAVFVGEVHALAATVLAGGDRGAVAVRETIACDAAVRQAHARAVTAQDMLPPAVAFAGDVPGVRGRAGESRASRGPCRRCPRVPYSCRR